MECILMGMHSHVELHVWEGFDKVLRETLQAIKDGDSSQQMLLNTFVLPIMPMYMSNLHANFNIKLKEQSLNQLMNNEFFNDIKHKTAFGETSKNFAGERELRQATSLEFINKSEIFEIVRDKSGQNTFKSIVDALDTFIK
jgi:hypothetical protein